MEDNKEMVLDKKDGSKNEEKEMVDKKPFHYKHARASIAVDVVVFGILPGKDELHVFVHQPPQKEPLHKNKDEDKDEWWLPGRFMHSGKSILDEIASDDNWTLERTMRDALTRKWKVGNKSETIVDGVKVISEESPEVEVSYTIKPNIDFICQLEPMSALDRDDRGWRVISIPYMTLICVKEGIPMAIPEKTAQWKPVSELINKAKGEPGALAHDHREILKNALKRLSQEIRTRPIGGSEDVVKFFIEKEKEKNKEDGARLEKVIREYMSEEAKNDLGDYVMLPSEFDASQLIDIYSVVLHTMGVSIERSNLKKLLIERHVIKETGNRNQSGKGGGTYRFDVDGYIKYRENLNFGFNPRLKEES